MTFGDKGNKRHWIIDTGHGGIVNGKYDTCPYYDKNNTNTFHKMWVHNGTPIYEGVFNRLVGKEVCKQLKRHNISCQLLVGNKDTPLKKRKDDVNHIYKNKPNSILLSIHGNAFNTSAKGLEVFTSKGETPSDPIAEVFCIEADNEFKGMSMRWDLSDGDKDKEANFYILKNTNCPAVLTENFFFDNKEDAKFMMSYEGIQRIAKYHVESILKIEKWT